MRNSQKILKALSSLIENGILTSKDLKKELFTSLEFRKEELINKLDLVKKEELIKYGGFHRSVELSQLYGIVPFGQTGFDEEAEFYWRRHEGQLNKELSRMGYCGAKELYSLIEDFNLRDRWTIYGKEVADHVVKELIKDMGRKSASLAVYNFFKFNRLQRGCN